MPSVKLNAVTKRQLTGSETRPTRMMGTLPTDVMDRDVADDATRLAISAGTAAQSDLAANATAAPAIDDAEAAKAMAELVSSQLTQQPKTALLAQANAPPEHVLALLRD